VIRILGLDPGSRATGWGAIEAEGGRVRAVRYGVIRPRGGDRAALLADLGARLRELVTALEPDTAAVESPFAGVSPRSALALAESRGVVLAVLGEAGLPVAAYSPAQVKAAVVGTGRAEKRQVGYMVARLLGLDAPPPQDAADALAVALTHQRLARWRARQGPTEIP